MLTGRAKQAWSALYDNLHLTTDLETKVLGLVTDPNAQTLPAGLSKATKRLSYATPTEISDYFRKRRDYIESTATLDLIVSVESAIREDLEARRNGIKSTTSAVGTALLATAAPPHQLEPAIRRLLPHWKLAATANTNLIDALDEGMQYRNWLAHGAIGLAPFYVNPFTLDVSLHHIFDLILAEP